MSNLLVTKSYLNPAHQNYSYRITHNTSTTKVLMIFSNSVINTDQLPSILEDLEKYFPAVLTTKCFNEENLPFTTEVKKTEIAHLFEHILIEYIYELKVEKGLKNIKVRGITEWNWQIEPYGTFNLMVNIGKHDEEIFSLAFKKTINIFNNLISNLSQYERQTAVSPSVFLTQI